MIQFPYVVETTRGPVTFRTVGAPIVDIMTDAEYRKLARTMPTGWLIQCMSAPSGQMTARHCAIIADVLDERGVIAGGK